MTGFDVAAAMRAIDADIAESLTLNRVMYIAHEIAALARPTMHPWTSGTRRRHVRERKRLNRERRRR